MQERKRNTQRASPLDPLIERLARRYAFFFLTSCLKACLFSLLFSYLSGAVFPFLIVPFGDWFRIKPPLFISIPTGPVGGGSTRCRYNES